MSSECISMYIYTCWGFLSLFSFFQVILFSTGDCIFHPLFCNYKVGQLFNALAMCNLFRNFKGFPMLQTKIPNGCSFHKCLWKLMFSVWLEKIHQIQVFIKFLVMKQIVLETEVNKNSSFLLPTLTKHISHPIYSIQKIINKTIFSVPNYYSQYKSVNFYNLNYSDHIYFCYEKKNVLLHPFLKDHVQSITEQRIHGFEGRLNVQAYKYLQNF